MTPTGSTMGNLDPARLSKLDNHGNHISGDEPTRENFLHMAMYDERPNSGAIVFAFHLLGRSQLLWRR